MDAAVNLFLGLLLFFPTRIVALLGVPGAASAFYPSLLEAVLLGIGAALLLECRRRPGGPVGLGLGGALAINLMDGTVLALWLLLGELDLPLRGYAFLWVLVVLLVGLSLVELAVDRRRDRGS